MGALQIQGFVAKKEILEPRTGWQRRCVLTHMCKLQRSQLVEDRFEGGGGGCHGDSNTPLVLTTRLPGPNLFVEEGEEEGGEGLQTCLEGRLSVKS